MEILIVVVISGFIAWGIIIAINKKRGNKNAPPISTKKGGGSGDNGKRGPKETGGI